MKDIQLSPHFKLSEFVKSSTASARGIDNTPDEKQIANLKRLCQEVLEPLRQHFGVPITIGSGFRCPKLNAAVGGVKNSNHLTGCAADLHLPNNEVGREWFRWLMDNTHFDELIWETSDRKRYWIHIALRPSGNRQRVVSFLLKK